MNAEKINTGIISKQIVLCRICVIISGISKRRLTNNLATCKVDCECPLYEKRYGTEMVNDGKERNQKTIQDTAK